MVNPSEVKAKTKACPNCAEAKAKCVRLTSSTTDQQSCQRCINQKLVCSTREPASTKKRGKAVRTEAIEHKLDDILSILRGNQDLPINSAISSSITTLTAPFSHTNRQPSSHSPSIAIASSSPDEQSNIEIVDGMDMTFEEADITLEEYTNHMLPQWPFVALSGLGAREMYEKTPLLLKTVLIVCRPPPSEYYTAFEKWFRQHVAYRIVVELEKSTEILQSIIVFLGWQVTHFYVGNRETNLLQLAVGILSDMQLLRNAGDDSIGPSSIVDDAMYLKSQPQPRPSQPTIADHRVAIGVFFAASMLSSYLGKPCLLQYGLNIEHSNEKLIQAQECETDTLAVYLVRLRRIAVDVDGLLANKSISDAKNQSSTTLAMTIASARRQLDEFMDRLPETLKTNYLLRNDFAAICIRLNEPAMYLGPSHRLGPDLGRSRTLSDCLSSTKMLFESFFRIPPESITAMSFVGMLHLGLAIVKSARLLFLDDRDWDAATARTSFDLPDLLNRLIGLYEVAGRLNDPRCALLKDGKPLISKYIERTRWYKDWYWSRVASCDNVSIAPIVMNPTLPSVDQPVFNFFGDLTEITY